MPREVNKRNKRRKARFDRAFRFCYLGAEPAGNAASPVIIFFYDFSTF